MPIKITVAAGTWSRDEARYSDRLLFKVGKVVVGAVEHPTRSKGQDRISRAALRVPGITLNEPDYLTDDEAKARVEKSFKVWLSWISAAALEDDHG